MTIEEKIDKLVSNFKNYMVPVECCKWYGMPGCISPGATFPRPLDYSIGMLIQLADEAECLLSKSEHVREYKKWFIQHLEFKITKQDIIDSIFDFGEDDKNTMLNIINIAGWSSG